jgi:hypothetical protein
MKADLAVFSPPYPNNIDYTEVYKLENWLLGLIDNQDDFRLSRRQTMRSHPSVTWEPAEHELPAQLSQELDYLTSPILGAIPEDRYTNKRRELVLGYVEDAARLFESLYRCLDTGAYAVYVVGNSRHGARRPFTIAADLLLAAVAEGVGFTVSGFVEARRLRRRGEDNLLRESVVVLKRGTGDD